MERNQGRNANIVYGICTNTGGKKDGTPCSKCQNKEKQAIRVSKEFVCEECGEPLTKVDPPKPQPPKWLYIILALAVVGGGIGAYFGFFKGSSTPEPDPVVSLSLNKNALTLDAGTCDTLKASISATPYDPNANISVSFTSDNTSVAQVDSVGVVRAITKGETTITVVASSPKGTSNTAKVRVTVNEILPKTTPDPDPGPTPKPSPKVKNTKTYSFGKYVGNLKNGIPEGDGKMYYHRRVQIAKHDTDNPPHYAESGDWFDGTWGNGDIISGALYSKDGKIKEKIFAPKRFNPYDLNKD